MACSRATCSTYNIDTYRYSLALSFLCFARSLMPWPNFVVSLQVSWDSWHTYEVRNAKMASKGEGTGNTETTVTTFGMLTWAFSCLEQVTPKVSI